MACAAHVEQHLLIVAVYLVQRVNTLVGAQVNWVDHHTEGLGYPADLGE